MPFIPIEDNFSDVITKAQRGLGVSNEELAKSAEITTDALIGLKKGELDVGALRRVARHLQLSPDALEVLAQNGAYPKAPIFPRGFSLFNTRFEDMTVNNYLVWDTKTREAAVIDTGAEVSDLLTLAASENLRIKAILLTHAHDDHVAALPQLVEATKADVWIDARENFTFPKLRHFSENDYFHLGKIAIKALSTWGHSPGQTTFYVQGLSWPLALCGDSLFSASIGGSPTHFRDQVKNTRARIFSLPKTTVIGPGHGPLTTLAHERVYNPFFAPDRIVATQSDPNVSPETGPNTATTPTIKQPEHPGLNRKKSSAAAFHARRKR